MSVVIEFTNDKGKRVTHPQNEEPFQFRNRKAARNYARARWEIKNPVFLCADCRRQWNNCTCKGETT